MDEWLEKLKVGDVVVIGDTYYPYSMSITKVERLTATQVIVGGSKYCRSNGSAIGGSIWTRNGMYEATPELVRKVKVGRARQRLIQVNWNNVSDELVSQIDASVTASTQAIKESR